MENRIRQVRKKRGVSQEKLATSLGITRQAISQYEMGNRQPRLETWQKLADFLGVTVPYLQGLEPDLYTLTPKTKELIISKLNTFYFDEGVNPFNAIDRLKDAVNEYARLAELTPLPSELKTQSKEEKNCYLNKYFSFLFEDSRIIERANEYFYSNYPTYRKKRRDNGFANLLARSISEHTIHEFQTELGFYIGQDIKYQLQNDFETFQRNLNFCNDVEDAKEQFNKFINSLSKTKNSLDEINNIDLDSFTRKAKLEQKIWNIALDVMLTNSDYKVYFEKAKNTYGVALSLKNYLVKNKKEIPKEINDYLEKYSSR